MWTSLPAKSGLSRGTTKNGEGRIFPFSVLPDLTGMIERQNRRTQELEKAMHQTIPWVFHRQGNRIKDFRVAWRKAIKAAGISLKIPHDFRRYCCAQSRTRGSAAIGCNETGRAQNRKYLQTVCNRCKTGFD